MAIGNQYNVTWCWHSNDKSLGNCVIAFSPFNNWCIQFIVVICLFIINIISSCVVMCGVQLFHTVIVITQVDVWSVGITSIELGVCVCV